MIFQLITGTTPDTGAVYPMIYNPAPGALQLEVRLSIGRIFDIFQDEELWATVASPERSRRHLSDSMKLTHPLWVLYSTNLLKNNCFMSLRADFVRRMA